jgi:hypothetical protein
MRRVLIAPVSVLLSTGCGKNDCEGAGGRCQQITPGACLGQVAGDQACDSFEICCLPLDHSACEKAGGKCVAHGTCTSGTVGEPSQYACSSTGATYECCLSADGGR